MLMDSTVSITSTISTQSASKFLFTYRPHHTWSVSIAAYLSNMYIPSPLTKVPPGHCISACPIPLIFSVSHDIGVHWADPLIELILAVHDGPLSRSLMILFHKDCEVQLRYDSSSMFLCINSCLQHSWW